MFDQLFIQFKINFFILQFYVMCIFVARVTYIIMI